MIPANTESSDGVPVDLSMIPKRSEMTVVYVRRLQQKNGISRTQNTILAVRFDRLNGPSNFPSGQMIPCFKPAQNPAPK